MLKIRMQRIGRKNMPAFRIIVAEHTRGPKTGNIVEKVGTYNPKTKEKQFNADRIKHWLSVGAQASATVHNMLVTAGIISGKKIVKHSEKPVPAEGGSSSEEKPIPLQQSRNLKRKSKRSKKQRSQKLLYRCLLNSTMVSIRRH